MMNLLIQIGRKGAYDDTEAQLILNSFTLPVMEFARSSGLLSLMDTELHLKMKAVKYSWQDKLRELICSIVAGCEHTVSINHRLVPDESARTAHAGKDLKPTHHPVGAVLSIGEVSPNFENLLGVDGRQYSLASFREKPVLVVIFSCNHCPYVQAYEGRMMAIQRDYSKEVQLVAINSNDEESHPEDSYPEMVKRAKEIGFNFPYLRDADQKVVSAYGAVCTPHVFVFDADRILRYRGRVDDSKDASLVKTHDLRNALDDILAKKDVRKADTKPFGCSIKWFAE